MKFKNNMDWLFTNPADDTPHWDMPLFVFKHLCTKEVNGISFVRILMDMRKEHYSILNQGDYDVPIGEEIARLSRDPETGLWHQYL